jgi:hypothetical protein
VDGAGAVRCCHRHFCPPFGERRRGGTATLRERGARGRRGGMTRKRVLEVDTGIFSQGQKKKICIKGGQTFPKIFTKGNSFVPIYFTDFKGILPAFAVMGSISVTNIRGATNSDQY